MKLNIKIEYNILIFIVLISGNVFSQSKNLVLFKEKIHIGKVLNTYIYMDSFPKRSAAVFNEFYIGAQSAGNQSWHYWYNFPQIGVSVITGNLGNKKQLGYTIGLVPSLTFNTHLGKNLRLKALIGFGFSGFNAPFDSVTNKYNILIGSKITNMSMAQLNFNYKLSEFVNLEYGFSFIHCSNGHYQVPNVGINVPMFSVGVLIKPDHQVLSLDTSGFKNYSKKLFYTIRFGTGIHEFAETTAPVGTPKYFIYTTLLSASKRITPKSVVQLGVSVKYYTDYYAYIKNNAFYADNYHLKSVIGTLFIGHEFLFRKMGFVINGGFDFYKPFYKKYYALRNREHDFAWLSETFTSTRLGVHYYFKPVTYTVNKNAFVGIYINANSAKADFAELAFGWVF